MRWSGKRSNADADDSTHAPTPRENNENKETETRHHIETSGSYGEVMGKLCGKLWGSYREVMCYRSCLQLPQVLDFAVACNYHKFQKDAATYLSTTSFKNLVILKIANLF